MQIEQIESILNATLIHGREVSPTQQMERSDLLKKYQIFSDTGNKYGKNSAMLGKSIWAMRIIKKYFFKNS